MEAHEIHLPYMVIAADAIRPGAVDVLLSLEQYGGSLPSRTLPLCVIRFTTI